jgi:Glycoside-hydrolase family GH114
VVRDVRRTIRTAVFAVVVVACGNATPPNGTSGAGSPSVAASPTAVATTEPAATPAEPSAAPTLSPRPSATARAIRLPPANAGFDYQLGGGYAPPDGVTVVSRDRTDMPAPGLFNICYINGFQIQSEDVDWWKANHPDLMLRDKAGKLVIDPDWDEIMLAPTTEQRRAELAEVIGGWIAGCAADGFDAVEIDNLDTFTRSHGLITEDDAVAQIRLFADAAHAQGLAIAQKNSAEIVGRRDEMGTDFAVAEECDRYSECDAYTGAYGDHVLVIEYRRKDFDKGCAAYPQLSIVLRDLDLVTPTDKGYVYAAC